MMTYDTSRRILFSGDGFGSYGALKGAVFEDQAADRDWYEREALRYFTNVVAKFHRMVRKAADRLREIDISVLAPAHGLCWRRQPRRIIDLYRDWSDYAESGGECGATVLYGTMYGCTEAMMNAVVAGIAEAGVAVEVFDAGRTHASYILPALWVNKGLVVGAPTYEGELFPAVAQVLRIAAMKAVRHKKVAVFGSYGWAGGAQREFEEAVEPMDVEIVGSLQFCGRPTAEELREGQRFGRRFGEALRDAV
jgi:flavorubredoxin